MVDAAEDGTRGTRSAALVLLGEIGEAKYVPLFRHAIKDPSERMREMAGLNPARVACHYLARLGTPESLTVLFRFALSTGDDTVRRAARFDVECWLAERGIAGPQMPAGAQFPFRPMLPLTLLQSEEYRNQRRA